MSRGKILTALLAVALIVVLIAVFESCRDGTRPPAERDRLEGTSFRASAVSVIIPKHVAVGVGEKVFLGDVEHL